MPSIHHLIDAMNAGAADALEVCPFCAGTGNGQRDGIDGPEACPACEGSGWFTNDRPMDMPFWFVDSELEAFEQQNGQLPF